MDTLPQAPTLPPPPRIRLTMIVIRGLDNIVQNPPVIQVTAALYLASAVLYNSEDADP